MPSFQGHLSELPFDPGARLRLRIGGTVQGVGFRPCVYRLATELGLRGWVNNTGQGVMIEVEGPQAKLECFHQRLLSEPPPRARIERCEGTYLRPVGYREFAIHRSDPSDAKGVTVLPDLATCLECLEELFDPSDRRYLYPFINCTHCGPRFSIIKRLPYDRENTTMGRFKMCNACDAEYRAPHDRRFHAQPNACPACGPQLALWAPAGEVLAHRHEALLEATAALRQGLILAVKGLGGFQLLVDARNEEAVQRLRRRKQRPTKPFAVMFPNQDAVAEVCHLESGESGQLSGPHAPIMLVTKRKGAVVAPSVAPCNPDLGVMLPYTPQHHLLLQEFGFPVVATSGNQSNEPLCTDEQEALERLKGVADLFLVHDRPIQRPVDDSVAHWVLGQEAVLRAARGYAPVCLQLGHIPTPSLAVGGHLKVTMSFTLEDRAVVSSHIGDLDTALAYDLLRRNAHELPALFEVKPEQLVCDLHPDYLSSQYARSTGLPLMTVQHHHAHVAACMVEHGLVGPVLGIAWDGTGYGDDGTVWGGEFLVATRAGYRRVGHLRTFRLPGGDRAITEPRRSALGLLHALFGEALWDQTELLELCQLTPPERRVFATMLRTGLNSPLTSSAGRLFDGVAALLGLRQQAHFEGEAALAVQSAAAEGSTETSYPFGLSNHQTTLVDWGPTLHALLGDRQAGWPVPVMAARFQNTLSEMVVALAGAVGMPCVLLTGGCFQNRALLSRTVSRLQAEGWSPYWHQRIPPNDGGLSVGQLAVAQASSEGAIRCA